MPGQKHELVVAMQQRLSALTQLDRSGLGDGNVRCEIFSLSEELAYLARVGTPTRKELNRLRAKFRLCQESEKHPTPRTVDLIADDHRPLPTTERRAGPLPQLPPQSFIPSKDKAVPPPHERVDRLRVLWERYCVHCDEPMVFEDRRFVCPRCRDLTMAVAGFLREEQ